MVTSSTAHAHRAMNIDEARSRLLKLKDALARSDRAAVNNHCAALVHGKAPLGKQWKAIATVLQHNGEHCLAIDATSVWISQQPEPEAQFEHVAVLSRGGRLDEAWAALGNTASGGQAPLDRIYLGGTILTNMGRLAEAHDYLRRAVSRAPQSGQAWLALAMTGRTDADDRARLEAAAIEIATAPPLEQAAFLYAKARMLDGIADPATIFGSIRRGAELVAKTRPYNEAADARSAANARTGWNALSAAGIEHDDRADETPAPIFVTGLPRSGTTLVEQILTAHSQIDDGGELGLIRHLQQDIGGPTGQAFEAHIARGGSIIGLRNLYLHLLAQRFPGHGRKVDKTLDASRNLGLISAIFPDSPVVWLRRDPLDCAWSAYRTWFAQGLSWSWRLEDIAAHFRLEDELHLHWQATLGDRLLTIDYADLVDRSEQTIDRLLEHCGLSREPACYAPQSLARAVTTASAVQVREPINRKSLNSAAAYRDFLKPFIDAYYT